MRAKPHPEQGFRSCLGILRLARCYGAERLEAACRRGVDIGAAQLRLDRLDPQAPASTGPTADEQPTGRDRRSITRNIRGRGYYH